MCVVGVFATLLVGFVCSIMVSERRGRARCRHGQDYLLQRDLKRARSLCEWVVVEAVIDDWEGLPYEVLPEVPLESLELQFQGGWPQVPTPHLA